MRKLIVTTIVSLDGYIAGPGGDVMALPMDHAFDEWNLEVMKRARTALFGATTYRDFVSFWPHAIGRAEFAGKPSAAIAERWPQMQKVAVSDSLTADDTGAWADTTRIVPRSAALAATAELREGDESDGAIIVWGSRTLWNPLLDAGLVDELHLMLAPVVLGDGVSAFAPQVSSRARLTGSRRWDGSENVLLSYEL